MTSASKSPSARRRDAVLSGYDRDEARAREYLADPDAAVRQGALGALVRMQRCTEHDLARALEDPDPLVRRRAAELAAAFPAVDVANLLDDGDPRVVEMAAWACGERTDPTPVPRLLAVVADHEDALCREAAVAALGAIGDPQALPGILAACSDKATVRRRAVLALAPFDGAEVDAALQHALDDRDWQVRQAAEDLLGS